MARRCAPAWPDRTGRRPAESPARENTELRPPNRSKRAWSWPVSWLASPGRAPGAARRRPVDALAVDRALVAHAAGAKRDLVAVQFAVLQRHRLAAGAQRAGHFLELLLEREIALGELPRPFHLGRDDPQVRGAPGVAALADRGGFVGAPFAHREAVRDHAGAGLQA